MGCMALLYRTLLGCDWGERSSQYWPFCFHKFISQLLPLLLGIKRRFEGNGMFLPESKRLYMCLDDWVPELDLTLINKAQLAFGFWLTDKHINAAQMQLKIQYPGCYGFQNTLLSQAGGFNRITHNDHDAIQIHHIPSRNHWVTTHWKSTKVMLYDSNYNGCISPDLKMQVENIYGRDKDIYPVQVYQQEGGDDCGLLAIAFAVHAASGSWEPIETISFDQNKMREHLIWCFEENRLLPFPKT